MCRSLGVGSGSHRFGSDGAVVVCPAASALVGVCPSSLGKSRGGWMMLPQLSGTREYAREQRCQDLARLSCGRERLVPVVTGQNKLGGGNWQGRATADPQGRCSPRRGLGSCRRRAPPLQLQGHPPPVLEEDKLFPKHAAPTGVPRRAPGGEKEEQPVLHPFFLSQHQLVPVPPVTPSCRDPSACGAPNCPGDEGSCRGPAFHT